MWKPLIAPAIFGGVVVFLWILFSWMILPWHDMVTHRFLDQEAVAGVLLENSPAEGVYVMPSIKSSSHRYEQMDRRDRKVWRGPFVFANIKKKGIVPNERGKNLIIGLLTEIIGAGLITWLLLHTKKLLFWQRVQFVTVIGFIIGFLSMIPFWNWWGFSAGYVIVSILDVTLGWLAGGLVIASLTKR